MSEHYTLHVNGVTYFTATHQDYGTELWRSDGTRPAP